MKTKFLLLTLFLLINSLSKAQNITGAFQFGINGCQVDGDTQGGYKKAGIKTGITVSTKTENKFAVESGLLLNTKGVKKAQDGYTEFKTNLNYIELPIIAKYRFCEKMGGELGILYNYLMSSKIIDETFSETPDTEFLKNYDIDASAGIRLYLNNNFEIIAQLEYSITKITNINTMPNWRNNVINISIVKRFNLSKK
ncbi:MAG: PorT family protein [Bacteroidales bacterium]|nr:PorT family protein [Bacteroidales bacterium]